MSASLILESTLLIEKSRKDSVFEMLYATLTKQDESLEYSIRAYRKIRSDLPASQENSSTNVAYEVFKLIYLYLILSTQSHNSVSISLHP